MEAKQDMILLDKYISKNFIKLSVYTTLLTSFMMMIIEMFISFQLYSNMKTVQMLTLMLLHFPNSVSLVIGPALLFATTYFISSLYSNNEFICFLSAGISYRRIILPIIIIALIFTGLLFAFNERIKIPFDLKYDQKKIEFSKASDSFTKDNRNVSLSDRERNVTIRAGRYIDSKQRLERLDIATFTPENTLDEKVTADSADYNAKSKIWNLKNAVVHKFDVDSLDHSVTHHDQYTIDTFVLEPKFFRAEGEDVKTMSIRSSLSYLKTIKYISSQMYAQKSTDFYKRIFTPFTALIMILVSLSSNLKNKKNALMYSIISSLALGVVYYSLDMAFTLMAKQGLVSPLMAVLTPIAGILVVSLLGASRVSS